jgi:diketogulonate reductase-like aldo/keto reductase
VKNVFFFSANNYNHTIVIPKSQNPQHIKENFNFLDFALDDDDLNQIDKLDCGFRLADPTRIFHIPLFS